MAGGRSTRRKSKASNTGKRALESTVSNAETKKGQSGGASVKGKKLKLQDDEKEHSDHRVDGYGIVEDSQESKYVPPFSRSAKKLTDNKCEGSTETSKRKSKRQASGKKSRQGRIHDSKSTQETETEKEQTVVEKENHNFQEVQSVAINEEAANAVVRAADLETNPGEDVMAGAKECMETILNLLACKECEYADSDMDVQSEHQHPDKEVMKDEMKPTSLVEETLDASLGMVERTNVDMCAKDGGTSRRNLLECTASDGLDADVARTDVALHETIHKFVKSHPVVDKGFEGSSERTPEVMEENALTAGDDEEIIALQVKAVAVPNSAEKCAERNAEVERTNVDFIKGLELVDKECDSKNTATSNNNKDNNDLGGNGNDSNVNKNNSTYYQMDVHNKNSSRSNDGDSNNHMNSSSKQDQTDNKETSNCINSSHNSSRKDDNLNNNENNSSDDVNSNNHINSSSKQDQTDNKETSNCNNSSHNSSRKDGNINNENNNRSNTDNNNISEVDVKNKALPHETDLGKAVAATDQEIDEGLSTGEGFEIVRSKQADNAVLDQQVPTSVLPDQDKEEMRHQNDTSMLTAEGRYPVSVKQMDSNGIQADVGSFQPVIKPTENTVLCELGTKESGYLDQESSAISKVEDDGPETCLSGSVTEDVLPDEERPQNEKEQARLLGVIPTVDHTQSGTFCNTALQSLHENPNTGEDLEPNHIAIQGQRITAITADGRALSSKDSTPEKMDSSPGQPENMERVRESTGVAYQETTKNDVDLTVEKVDDECLLDVECEMDCTDSQLVDLDESSLEAIVVDTTKERTQRSMFAESDEASGSRKAPNLAADVSRASEDEIMGTCDMIKGLTTELSALNRYLMAAWKDVEAIRKQRQARLKANKSKRAKQ